MKKFLVLAAVSLISGSAFAGPSVSGGIGEGKNLLRCEGGKGQALEVRSTPMPGYIQGVYIVGKSGVSMTCVPGKGKPSFQGQTLWNCDELRPGEGQLSATIYRNSQGIVLAQIFQKDMTNQSKPLEGASLL